MAVTTTIRATSIDCGSVSLVSARSQRPRGCQIEENEVAFAPVTEESGTQSLNSPYSGLTIQGMLSSHMKYVIEAVLQASPSNR